ncbi:MAG: hypothetical protein J6B85_08095 [Lachnospiraceae bacterium]|nr:hypothetical protein [Lachnospiraceae bacterium]
MDLNNLSLHDKICQMLVVKLDPEKHIRKYGSIRNFMEQYPVGGLFIAREILFDDSYDLQRTRELIAEYQKYAKIPLLVAADAESGAKFLAKEFTELPPPMALGSAQDESLAYDYGKAIAKECRAIGVNWSCAPVCDMIMNRYNEIVRTRSISNDPELTAKMLAQEIRGFQEHGVLTTGKHFPGDGCDARNQHIVCSVNNLSKEDWMNSYGRVFQAAFDAGMASVMVGHISVPAFQKDAVNGVYPPATLSKDAIDLLKNELGFKGVALTDAMDMGGFVRWIYSRKDAEVEAFKCGIDMMLWPREETSDLIEEALRKGEIPMSRLDDAIERIAFLKNTIADFGFGSIEDETGSAFSRSVSERLAERSSTLAVNSLGLIPVKQEEVKKVRIITATECMLNTRDGNDRFSDFIADEFRKYGAEVDLRREWDVYLADFEAGEIDRDYDLIVYCVYANSALPLYARELVNIHSAQRFDNEKTIVMVLGTPHYLSEYFPMAETAIHTYANHQCAADAIAAIYGKKAFTGTLPIR